MKYVFIYRVKAKRGPYVSAWVATKKQARAILKNVVDNPIFGGPADMFEIEESSMLI